MEQEFVCQYCDRICKTSQGKSYHENRCNENPNRVFNSFKQSTYKTTSCPICGAEQRNCNLERHIIKCKYEHNKKPKEKVKRTGKLAPFYGKTPWNKGLTKETDERIRRAAEKVTHYYDTHPGTFTNRKHTEETKKKISDSMTKYNHSNQKRNLHSKGEWYDDIYFMSTWELAYYIYKRDSGVGIKRCEDRFQYFYENNYHYYTPDFILENFQYVEIKGREKAVDFVKYESVENLIVLHYKDIKHMISYVLKQYGVHSLTELYEK